MTPTTPDNSPPVARTIACGCGELRILNIHNSGRVLLTVNTGKEHAVLPLSHTEMAEVAKLATLAAQYAADDH